MYNLVEPDLVKYEVLETWTHASNDDRRVPCWGVTRNDGPRGNVFAWYNNQALAESVAIFLNNMRASEVSR